MRLTYVLAALIFAGLVSPCSLAGKPAVRLEVIDPYAEIRTGPGRGYPIFYVVEQGESIEVLARRPGWYEVKAQNGRIGWTSSAEISRTLQETGEPADLPEVGYGDYLKNSVRVGFTAGSFVDGELKGAETFSATLGYRPLSWLVVEAEYGKFYESDIRGDFYGANILLEPFSKWVVSPVLLIGTGVMSIDTQPELVQVDIDDSNFNNYGLGVNYYLGRNFVVRAEYRSYTVSTEQEDERLGAWKIGFNSFF